MKTKFIEKKSNSEEYPGLYKSYKTGQIILFSSKDKGTVLVQGDGDIPVGYHATNWDMDSCYRISGKIKFTGNKSNSEEYPMLGKSAQCGRIILFSAHSIGTILVKCKHDHHSVGYHATNWYMPYYNRISGKVKFS